MPPRSRDRILCRRAEDNEFCRTDATNHLKPSTALFERAAMASPAPPPPRYDATSPAEDAADAADDEWHFVNARGAREGPTSATALASALGTDAARWESTWVWCADRCAEWTPAARADALSARMRAAIARGGGVHSADEEKPASPYEDASRGDERATTTTFGSDADADAAAAAAAGGGGGGGDVHLPPARAVVEIPRRGDGAPRRRDVAARGVGDVARGDRRRDREREGAPRGVGGDARSSARGARGGGVAAIGLEGKGSRAGVEGRERTREEVERRSSRRGRRRVLLDLMNTGRHAR